MNKLIIYSTFVLGIVLLFSVIGRTQSELVTTNQVEIIAEPDTSEVVFYSDTLPASKANISQTAFLIKP